MKNFEKENWKKFIPHLEILRVKIYRLVILFLITFVLGFAFSGLILKKFVNFFDISNVTVVTTSPFQFADLAMSIGFFVACVITFPVFVFQLVNFLFPGLNKKEKFLFLLMIPASILLFVFGFIYGFYILYYSFALVAKINQSFGIENIWDISLFLSQIISTASLLGLVFQFPLILTALIKLEFIDVNFLKQKRRVAMFSIAVLVSLLPPTDGISLIVMVVPLIVLYEITILINFNKKYVWIRN